MLYGKQITGFACSLQASCLRMFTCTFPSLTGTDFFLHSDTCVVFTATALLRVSRTGSLWPLQFSRRILFSWFQEDYRWFPWASQLWQQSDCALSRMQVFMNAIWSQLMLTINAADKYWIIFQFLSLCLSWLKLDKDQHRQQVSVSSWL